MAARMETSRTHWPLVALLWATGLLAAAQFAKLTLTLDALALAYPGAPVAFAVSGVAVVGVIGGALSGAVVARIGVRSAVLWSIGISGALALIQGLPMPFWALMLTRVLEGVGHLGLVVALPTMMAALAAPSDKSVVMGLWGTFFGVSYALFALLVPVGLAVGGIRLVYAAHGVMLLALWPVLWRALPRVMAKGVAMPGFAAVHRTIYSTPRLLAPAVGHGIYTSLFIALVAFLPGALNAPWLTPLLPVTNLLGTFSSGFLARWVSPQQVVVGGFAASAVLFVGAAFMPWLALPALFATGVTAGGNFAAVPALNLDPADQARANGAMAQLGNVGTFSGTPLFAVAVMAGLWGVTGLAVAICLAGVLFAGWVYGRAAR